MKVLITIPTLGSRLESIVMTISSLKLFLPDAFIDVRTPNPETLKQLELDRFPMLTITHDPSDQKISILNSWRENSSDWYTWINDDDFALAGVEKALEIAFSYQYLKSPMVIYGNQAIMDYISVRQIPTPKSLTLWKMYSGSNYVPGILTFLNFEAVNTLSVHEKDFASLRNSFDYQWWLILLKSKAKFLHSSSTHAVWRQHQDARTQKEKNLSEDETQQVKLNFTPHILSLPGLKYLNSMVAKILVRFLRIFEQI